MMLLEARNNPDFTVAANTTETFKMEKIDRLIGMEHDTTTGIFNVISNGKERIRIDGSLSIEDFGAIPAIIIINIMVNGVQQRRDSDFLQPITPNRKTISFFAELDVFESDQVRIDVFSDQTITILANGQLSYVYARGIS